MMNKVAYFWVVLLVLAGCRDEGSRDYKSYSTKELVFAHAAVPLGEPSTLDDLAEIDRELKKRELSAILLAEWTAEAATEQEAIDMAGIAQMMLSQDDQVTYLLRVLPEPGVMGKGQMIGAIAQKQLLAELQDGHGVGREQEVKAATELARDNRTISAEEADKVLQLVEL